MLRTVGLALLAAAFTPFPARSQSLDLIGVTLLQTLTTNLNGSGIRVAQPEAPVVSTPDTFEINPANVGLPGSRFTYVNTSGMSATTYPNTVGTNSWHAERVGNNFYGPSYGVATNLAHVDNYDANYFVNNVIGAAFPASINDAVVNQSFDTGSVSNSVQEQIDSIFDNYATRFNTLFISGAGDGGPISPPSTCYNGIAVACCDGGSSYGPTPDNGRSKPDLTAPGSGAVIPPGQAATSYSTPYVSGSATVLLQAALRGDGGSNPTAAADMRTLKALLLNGAVKPIGWTNSSSAPLHAVYGAGIVNVFNSYEEMAGSKHPWIVSNSVVSGALHPPAGATGTIGTNSGWDFDSLTSVSNPARDSVTHYYFNLSNAIYTATATLVWNRQYHTNNINHLALFLYNAANSNLVMESTSMVDNVQHIYLPRLSPGRYDLQVWKAGGSGIVTASESYAVEWAFTAPAFKAARSGTNLIFTWPVYPAGYALQGTPNLTAPVWSTNNIPGPNFATGTNVVTLPYGSGLHFFRLQQPGS